MDNDRLNEKDISGFFPKLSRTLYIGNLNENINDATLYKYFGEFGDIISINIEKEDYVADLSLKVYAFIKYFDTSNVVLAMVKMNGVDIEGCRVCLGFGKSYPSKCVWITGINESGDNNFLLTYLADCGPIITCSIDQINKRALVYFKEIADAEAAINKMNDGFINGLYFRGDYASVDCQLKFAEFFNKQNHKNCLYMGLDNVDIQNPSVSNVNKQKSAKSHYVEADNTCIASKESTSQTTCIWVDGIADSITNEYLESHFSQFGPIKKCLVDRFNKCALLCFREELHAQSAVTVMNGSYIEGKSVYVRLASLRCQNCDVSNINNDDFTIPPQDNIAQSSPYSTRHVDPSCKCTINDETYPINISDPRNNSINVNNAHYTPQHKYLNTYNINIPKDSSNTNHVNNSSITIIFDEYPPERFKPIQYADSDVLSLPLPEFAKNISKELTSTSSRYSLSSNTGGNQDTYTFNVHHDEMINYGLSKTYNQDEKQDQNNNHPLKSNYKILESVKSIKSAAEQQNLFFEEAKRLQDVSNKHTLEEFIQAQSSPKFKDQQLSSSLGTFSTSGSSKYSLGHAASVIQSQYYPLSSTHPKIIPQNIKTTLIDTQILPSDPKLLIDPKCASASHRMISDVNGLFLTKQNICTISNDLHTSDVINTDFINPIPEYEERDKKFLEIVYKIRDEYTKHWVTTSNWSINTPNYNCFENLDDWWLCETSEKEDQKRLQNKKKNKQSVDGFIAKDSIEPIQPIFVDVEKSTNIDEEKTDNDTYENRNEDILLSLNKNYQNRIVHNKTKDKIKKTNCNESASSISNNGNSKKNKSVDYNNVKINEYKDNESQNISSITSMESKSHYIKSNKIQGEVVKTNVNEYSSKYLNIKKIKEPKKPILYFDHHEKKNKYCKPKKVLDSESIEVKFSKSSLFESGMFKTDQTINKKKEVMINSEKKNKDYKFGKGPTTIEEEKQNLNILKSHKDLRKDYKYKKNEDIYQNYSDLKFNVNNDNKSKKYINKVDENIISSYCSTENSLKKSVSDLSENHNDSKKWRTDNKTYKNNSTKTSKHHSDLNINNNNDNKSKKYINKVDGNIISSYCSTENSLKRSVSDLSENHNDSKRWKTDNKTYKNNSTKTSKHHSDLNINNNNDNKSKKYINKVDRNITSSYCSTENSLKKSVSDLSENHNDSKKWRTDNKTYKDNSTKTSKHHSPMSKPRKIIHNDRKPAIKNMSKLDKTPNQPEIRGWINGHSMFDILSNEPKVSISNKVKARSTNNIKNEEEWTLLEKYCNRKKIFESDN